MLRVYWEAIVSANMLLLIVDDVVATKTRKTFGVGGNRRDAFPTFTTMSSFRTRMPKLPRSSPLEAHASIFFQMRMLVSTTWLTKRLANKLK